MHPLIARVLLIVCVFLTALIVFFDPAHDVSHSADISHRSMIQEMGESFVIISDFDVRVTLHEGKAEFPADPTEPEGVRGSIALLPIHVRGMDAQGRSIVIGSASVSGGGSGVFAHILLFSDNGRSLGFVDSFGLGQVTILDMRFQDETRDHQEGAILRVRILAREDGEEHASLPSHTRVLLFRISDNSDRSIMPIGEEGQGSRTDRSPTLGGS